MASLTLSFVVILETAASPLVLRYSARTNSSTNNIELATLLILDSLLRYQGHSMSSLVEARLFSQVAHRFKCEKPQHMNFDDWICEVQKVSTDNSPSMDMRSLYVNRLNDEEACDSGACVAPLRRTSC